MKHERDRLPPCRSYVVTLAAVRTEEVEGIALALVRGNTATDYPIRVNSPLGVATASRKSLTLMSLSVPLPWRRSRCTVYTRWYPPRYYIEMDITTAPSRSSRLLALLLRCTYRIKKNRRWLSPSKGTFLCTAVRIDSLASVFATLFTVSWKRAATTFSLTVHLLLRLLRLFPLFPFFRRHFAALFHVLLSLRRRVSSSWGCWYIGWRGVNNWQSSFTLT